MKIRRFITGLETFDVGAALVTRLVGIYPECSQSQSSFDATLSEDDPRLPHLLAELDRAGLTPAPCNQYAPGFIRGKHFFTGRVAWYEESDFERVRYLSVRPDFYPRLDEENYSQSDPPVRLLMEAGTVRGFFASTNFDHLLVTNLGRDALARAAFVGISFVPAYLVHPETHDVGALREEIKAGLLPDLGQPSLWEIRPTINLPPMLPVAYRHHVNGEDRLSRNPIDVDRRMAYAKADLDRVGPFDIAQPDQADAEGTMYKDNLVTSQRFFQFMKKQKGFNLDDWLPVREE